MNLRRMSKSAVTMALVLGASIIGCVIACIDIYNSHMIGENEFYVLASAVLAYARPKLLWLWPMLFALTLYAGHIWAIRHGYRQPYVEQNEDYALACLCSFFPALAGGLLGGVLYVCRGAWRTIQEE